MTQSTRTSRLAALQSAIDRAGGLITFCEQMGVSHQAVTAWRKRGYLPPQRALDAEVKFGVNRIELVREDVAALLSAPQSDAAGVI